MLSLENGLSRSQPAPLDGLPESSRQYKLKDRAAVYALLLNLDSESLQILKAVAENSGIGSKLLEEKVRLSRAPILERTKKMAEADLLIRSVLAGTENRSKPTYAYALPAYVTLVAIQCAIAKLSLEEYLRVEKNSPGENGLPSGELARSEAISSSLMAIEAMAEVLKVAVERIADLEGRLSRIEQALQNSASFDRDKLLELLHSRS